MMKRFRKQALINLILISMLCLGFFGNSTSQHLAFAAEDIKFPNAPDAPMLEIFPSASTLVIGDTVTVDIVVSDMVDLYGVALELTFDPNIVEVVDADAGSPGVQIAPGSCPSPDFPLQNTVDNTTGTINYDAASLAPSPPCNGTGVVASITFHALAAGISPVHFNSWLLSDTNGVEIQTSAVDGSIEVTTGQTDTVLIIDPASANILISDTITIDIVVADVADLYGVALELTFDATIVEVVDADPSSPGVQITPGACPAPDFPLQNTVDNVAGTINYDVASLAPSPPCNGTGVVASITFHGIGTGNSPVHFSSWLLSDSNGLPISAEATDGSVTVGDNGSTLLWIDPSEATIPVSGTFTVDIAVADVSDLYGVALELTFDPTVVEVVDDDPGTPGIQITPGSCPAPDFPLQNTADNTAGTINYDVASLAPSPPCNGSGVIASVTFHALVGPDQSPVHFNSWLLSDSNGGSISVTTQDGILYTEDEGALLWINPPFSTIPISTTGTVDIAINDINELYGIQLVVSFDPTKVEVVDADPGIPGIQITPGSCPEPDFVVLNEVDNVSGTISYGAASLNPSPPCNGNGVVASVTFHGLEEAPVSPVHFVDWLLSDTDGFPIPISTQDGELEITLPPLNGSVILQGRTDHSGVIVSAWDGGVEIASTITNASGDFGLGVPAGTYLISAEMERYLDSEKPGVVVGGGTTTLATVELLGGDANDDDLVNVQDLAIVGSHFLMVCGDPGWDDRADINNDCVVNILDLTLTGINFHLSSPVPWP